MIEDTGTGLDAAGTQPDFEGRGAGLGLRVARRLVAAMRGALLLEVTDEGGTRATLRLSAAAPLVDRSLSAPTEH